MNDYIIENDIIYNILILAYLSHRDIKIMNYCYKTEPLILQNCYVCKRWNNIINKKPKEQILSLVIHKLSLDCEPSLGSVKLWFAPNYTINSLHMYIRAFKFWPISLHKILCVSNDNSILSSYITVTKTRQTDFTNYKGYEILHNSNYYCVYFL